MAICNTFTNDSTWMCCIETINTINKLGSAKIEWKPLVEVESALIQDCLGNIMNDEVDNVVGAFKICRVAIQLTSTLLCQGHERVEHSKRCGETLKSKLTLPFRTLSHKP